MSLETYRRKRRFGETSEPQGADARPASQGRFVVQKHAASRLHYDLRLEIGGVLKCWAVPKGPSLDPADKRLAARTEDHPEEYLTFEKVIPPGNYGAGAMIVWDTGTFETEGNLSAPEQLEKGEIKFVLYGAKLGGGFVLVRTTRNKKAEEWLLIKHRDAAVVEGYDIEAFPESALTGRTLADVSAGLPPGQGAAAGPAVLEGAIPAEMPTDLKPMLASSRDTAFSDPGWIYELKWDGVRIQAQISGQQLRLVSRNGRDVTSHYPELRELPFLVRAKDAVLDGEIVALDAAGRSDFGILQSRMHVDRPSAALVQATPVYCWFFDLIYADGYDLRQVRLVERKTYLKKILRQSAAVRYSDHIAERGEEFFELARDHGAEGMLAKRADSPYVNDRSADWQKIKIVHEVDVVVGGWTAPRGGREHLGALLAGFYDKGKLRFLGGVGSGFTEANLRFLAAQLDPLETKQCPFSSEPVTKEKAHWLQPQLVARVRYSGWTRDDQLRHPVFLGLRDDVDATECKDPRSTQESVVVHAPRAEGLPFMRSIAELEKELHGGKKESLRVELDGKEFRLTHLDKVYFPEHGYTKRDLLAYYLGVSEYILPFLKDRPLVLHRFPNGAAGESFYQKDIGEGAPEWVRTVVIPSESSARDTRYYVCDDLATLLHLVNLGCIEQHPWPSRVDSLEKPDYVFFDLDPTEGYEFDTVVSVARRFLKELDELGLSAFLKTSGSRGIHLWLPLERIYSYEQIRTFAEIVARVVHDAMRKETTLERTVDKRPKGSISLDYLQNSFGKPLATVYTARPRPLATVATPLSPAELRKGLKPEKFTIKTLPARLKKKGDLWADFWKSRQRIEPALKELQKKLAKIR
jgi:bifunctional non-homologous end joining protein LigD